jgi:hypothetical protein
MKKSEKDYLKHKFRGLPEDEQRTEILETIGPVDFLRVIYYNLC